MQKKEIIRRNPLRLMGYDREDILEKGGFGAVLARAGVGKTAFLVQLALDKMLRGKNVLHVSIGEPVDKVCLWYEEVFRTIAEQCEVTRLDKFFDAILPNRFIMTFKVEAFTVPKLVERLTDLTEQGIFFPRMLLVDGLSFENTEREVFQELKKVAEAQELGIWFTVRTHRHLPPGEDGVPVPLAHVVDLFDVAIELKPDENHINLECIKGGPACDPGLNRLRLDPSNMMILD